MTMHDLFSDGEIGGAAVVLAIVVLMLYSRNIVFCIRKAMRKN